MKKIWVKKFNNFASANKFDQKYYQEMGAGKRLETGNGQTNSTSEVAQVGNLG